MASTFKTFVSDDIANTRTLLHEAIPITGSIVNSVTYTSDENIKSYGHGMFQSVYDYPYTSSSANHIFDMTYGSHSTDGESNASNEYTAKRNNIYNQMAQVLVGHDVSGNIRKFDVDGDLTGGTTYDDLLFFNFARLLGKDEIKKGTFLLTLGVTTSHSATVTNMHSIHAAITDTGAESDYRVNSPAGEYAVLRINEATTDGGGSEVDANAENAPCGLIYYQAGIVALDAKILNANSSATPQNDGYLDASAVLNSSGGEDTISEIIASETITTDVMLADVRKRIVNIQFSNTTELNSTIYFCRVGHNDFNYSSNPTYLENSKIRVKNKTTDAPVSYITTVGLYSADNEMLAVAKLSEPLRKDPTNDITLRVRLDY